MDCVELFGLWSGDLHKNVSIRKQQGRYFQISGSWNAVGALAAGKEAVKRLGRCRENVLEPPGRDLAPFYRGKGVHAGQARKHRVTSLECLYVNTSFTH